MLILGRAYDRAALVMRGPAADTNFPFCDYDDASMEQLRLLNKKALVLAIRATLDDAVSANIRSYHLALHLHPWMRTLIGSPNPPGHFNPSTYKWEPSEVKLHDTCSQLISGVLLVALLCAHMICIPGSQKI